jgi:hypothetical protein
LKICMNEKVAHAEARYDQSQNAVVKTSSRSWGTSFTLCTSGQ